MSKEIGELSVKKELRIGVVIPSYIRHIPLLKRCLDSIETQTKPPNIVSISCSSSKKDSVNLTSYSFPIKINYTEEVQNAAQNRNYAASIILEEVDVI